MVSGCKRLGALLAIALGAASSAQAQVVISQVYGGGGNNGAPWRSDFIELHNPTTELVSINGWSVQYASATGTTWARTDLTGYLPAGGYYLIKQADGAGAGDDLPTPDAIGNIPMSGTAGKVVLVPGAFTLTGACPTGNPDLVGYGTTANCSEGSAPAPAPSNTLAILRAGGGCTDTNNNGADFAVGTPVPRNSGSSPPACGGEAPTGITASPSVLPNIAISGDEVRVMVRVTPGQNPTSTGITVIADLSSLGGPSSQILNGPSGFYGSYDHTMVIPDGITVGTKTIPLLVADQQGRSLQTSVPVIIDASIIRIHAIQGNGPESPLRGMKVSTEGVVTGRTNDGFFLQSSMGAEDYDDTTSEGIFVYVGAAPAANIVIGAYTRVHGLVSEYIPSADPHQAPFTELVMPTVFAFGGIVPLPYSAQINSDRLNPESALDALEPLEGMRVNLESLTVVAPTGGNTNESNATGTSNGLFHGVLTFTGRPFREPGIEAPNPAPQGSSIPPLPRWDANPELIAVDSDALGGPALDLPAGTVIQGLTGPLDYSFRRYTLLRDPQVPVTVSGVVAPTAAREPTADEFTIAAYNLERFFDTVNDPAIGEPVLTQLAFTNRLGKASLAIRNYLNLPDILATVEVENLTTLQALAGRINADALAASQPNPNYVAYLQEGNDVGGIDVGFLVKTGEVAAGISRVQVMGVTQMGKETTWVEPSGTVSLLNDRPLLALDAQIHYANGRETDTVTAIVVHQRSLNDVESNDPSGTTTLGDRVRQKRQRQAEYLATAIQQMQVANPSRRIVVLGDFNAFAFNDGLADTMNVVTGTPTPDEQTAVPGDGADLVDPDLVNLGVLEPSEERYSFVFGGNAQSLDHVLANEEMILASTAFGLDHARINADFPEVRRNDASSPARLSDHDPVVAYFESRQRADLAVSIVPESASVPEGQALAYAVTVTNLGGADATAAAVGFALGAVRPRFAVSAPAGWDCDAPLIADGATSIACLHAVLAKGASATFIARAIAAVEDIGSQVSLAAATSSQVYDSDQTNNQTSASISVATAPLADIGVQLSGPASVPAGTSVIDYTATLLNHGSLAARQPVVVISGASVQPGSITAPPQWLCSPASSRVPTLQCNSDLDLVPGATVVFNLQVTAPPSGSVQVSGWATSSTRDADMSDNADVVTTALSP